MSERKVAVVKLSGSLVSPPSPLYLRRLRDSVERARSSGWRLGIVVGGGATARSYITALRELGVPESILDEVGIESAVLNAMAVASALYPYSPIEIPRNVREALTVFEEGLIPVLGGLQPGHSTNAVAAVLAETIGADLLLNLLNGVAGVYAGGAPGEPGARLLRAATYDELENIVRDKRSLAGTYELFDSVAVSVVRRSHIKVRFVDGRDPEVIQRILLNQEDLGTLVG
ncbi:Probable uridylate kinase [Acidilobus saccharovorans 345-15]|uniref:UMP kinase n=1 Tax=Acidilobus saccharovorans (strain DSM 16705 / JCM 18335 / VKM B-2471 / 345-15) TaxID=666510 RepID=D9Q0J0_ACIS3|nr:UMP kinase [Acidilobus saccharovorans]ADL18828.1 Probable uridylate kinase [Acidilobus saccharovorans 345-15]